MADNLFEIAKSLREILNKNSTEDRRTAIAAAKYVAAYMVGSPNERNDIIRKETLEGMMRDIKDSGFFKPEKYSILEKIIPRVGGYNNDPFSYEDCLSDAEKEALHIDTSFRVSREMVDCLSEKGLAQKDPRNIIQVIYYMNYFAMCRKYKLIELKARGVTNVKIVSAGGDMDCKPIGNIEKTFSIDNVPGLPLPECTAPYCRCEYAAGD
ncbi:MAG: hypothetical protein LBN21_02895 [Treponema sp.]|jgi:hypothetical protein|nr:hypothetical protein [Treponema sp.]